MADKIVLRSGVHIGEPAAEDDAAFLAECFVDLPVLSQITDIDSPKCIILGRTGSGKTAILNHIEKTHDNVIRVSPEDVSFDYIANSNIISFLIDIGFDLHILFENLWKHVLCTKAIQCYFENQSVFEKALGRITDKNNAAKRYFERYRDTFWVEHDEVLREISEGFEQKIASELKAALGSDYGKIEAGLAAHLAISTAQRKEIVFRAKKAVSDLQIRELAKAIETLDEMMENKQKKFYITIDDLDLDWVDNSIKYDLIRALIESIKKFRKVRLVKTIIALRSDIYERALISANSESIQPEKYEGVSVELKWSKNALHKVLDKRINFLFKNQYTKKGVKFSDVFPSEVRRVDSISYLIDRTLMRPRDLIAFVNIVLDKAAGSATVSPKHITDSEADYSKKRYQALCHEWRSLHPSLDFYLRFLKGKTGKNEFRDIAAREIIVDLCLSLDDLYKGGKHKDSVVRNCELYAKRENETRLHLVAASLLSVLYKVGAINLKLSKGDIFRSSYTDEPFILPEQISFDSAFSVSPMLWRTLGITPNIG